MQRTLISSLALGLLLGATTTARAYPHLRTIRNETGSPAAELRIGFAASPEVLGVAVSSGATAFATTTSVRVDDTRYELTLAGGSIPDEGWVQIQVDTLASTALGGPTLLDYEWFDETSQSLGERRGPPPSAHVALTPSPFVLGGTLTAQSLGENFSTADVELDVFFEVRLNNNSTRQYVFAVDVDAGTRLAQLEFARRVSQAPAGTHLLVSIARDRTTGETVSMDTAPLVVQSAPAANVTTCPTTTVYLVCSTGVGTALGPRNVTSRSGCQVCFRAMDALFSAGATASLHPGGYSVETSFGTVAVPVNGQSCVSIPLGTTAGSRTYRVLSSDGMTEFLRGTITVVP